MKDNVDDILFEHTTDIESLKNYITMLKLEHERFCKLSFIKRIIWLVTGKY